MKIALALCATLLFVVLVQAEQECSGNETKQEDCNTCFCTNGHWSCTKKGCIRSRRDISCQPGTTFQDKCNSCHCNPDGKSARCTLKACPHQ